MTEGEKAIVRQIAFEVGDVLMNRFQKEIIDGIRNHANTCNTKETVKKAKYLLIGVGIGCAAFGAGGALWIADILKTIH